MYEFPFELEPCCLPDMCVMQVNCNAETQRFFEPCGGKGRVAGHTRARWSLRAWWKRVISVGLLQGKMCSLRLQRLLRVMLLSWAKSVG